MVVCNQLIQTCLMTCVTYLSSARIENKIRKFSFNQIFKIDSNNSIIHNFKFNVTQRYKS